MLPTLRLAQKTTRPALKAALKGSTAPKPAAVNQPLRPAKPLSDTVAETLAGGPARPKLSDREAAAAKGKNKTIVDSFRSLPSNQRILVGVAIGAVGLAGLFWDRTMEEAEQQEQEYGFERVAGEIEKRKAEKR